ncbi:hypothetical protein A2U01_0052894, partial [Trifolium medium]|nr:hypothetical protein [Trifolium medium]
AKKDKGGRRFGFARFDRVVDPRNFEFELDNIIIGRDKISINLSRFHRPEDIKRSDDMRTGRKGIRDNYRMRNTSKSNRQQAHQHLSHETVEGSYAQVVKKGRETRQEGCQNRVDLSYEAEENDVVRLKKAFIRGC